MHMERWEFYALCAGLVTFGLVLGLPVGAAWWRHATGPGFSSAVERDLQRLSDGLWRGRGSS